MSANARAIDLPHEGFGSYFLDTFDRPKRVTVCECERSTGATLQRSGRAIVRRFNCSLSEEGTT